MSVWAHRSLGDVLTLEYGKPLPPSLRTPDGTVPVYGANGIKDWTKTAFRSEPTIIVGRKGSAGEIQLTDGPFWPLDVTYFVNFDRRQHDLKFLYYLLDCIDLRSLAKGVKPGLNRNEAYDTPVSLPPLEDQRRIVAVLDEAFAAIATATANAEKNLANAEALFEVGLAASFCVVGKPLALGTIAKFVRGPFGGSLKKEIFQPSGFAVYEQQHAIYDQFLRIRYFVNEQKFSEMARFQVEAGDILMSCSGTIGRVALVPSDASPGIINQALLKLSPASIVDPKYLLWYMRSEPFLDQIAARSGGAALQNVASVAVLKEISVTLPSLEAQRTVSSHIEGLRAECDGLVALYSRKISKLSDLRKSLLHRAFAGELTSEEHETIAA